CPGNPIRKSIFGNIGRYESPSGTAAKAHFASTSTLRPSSRISSPPTLHLASAMRPEAPSAGHVIAAFIPM
ncbi:hypothetical protein VIGAN_04130800, partial [Vigna angularis var. angularis]